MLQIEEVHSDSTNTTFTFKSIPNQQPADKKFKEYLQKWGLDQSFQILSFRFDLKFDDLRIDQFLLDFFNSPDVRGIVPYIQFPKEQFSKILFDKLLCTETKTDMFDKLNEKIVFKDSIKQTFEDYFDDIQIADLLRESILKEDSEYYPIFTTNDRNQLLFRLFKIFVLGGQLCQYEDHLSVYLENTKQVYKSLVTARKDPVNEQIFIESFAYQIIQIGKSYEADHPQNIQLVIVNPALRQVYLVVNQWLKVW